MSLFTFSLDFIQITETRSLVEDTDYVSFTLALNGTPQTLVRAVGALGKGTHTVNLSFNNVTVNPTDTVVLNYLIINSGEAARVNVETAMERVGAQLVAAGPGLNVPQLSSALQVIGNWLIANLPGIADWPDGGCNGPVAAEQDTFTGTALAAKTANGKFTQVTTHQGIHSGFACGGNSVYIVNWHMIDLSVSSIAVPNVFELSEADAKSAIEAAGLVAVFETPPSKPTGHTASVTNQPWVFSQAPPAGIMVTAGITVTMVLHTGNKP